MLGRNMLSMTGLSLFRNAIQFGLNVVLAGFITPEAYGLVVFTTPFLVLVGMMTDLGMSVAIIRSPNLTRHQAGAAMVVMAVAGGGCAMLLASGAGLLEHVIAMPGLAPVMRAMSGVIVLSLIAATPRALQERQLHYGRIAGVEACATALSAVVGLTIAIGGGGVWALVVYNLLTQLLRALAFSWLSRRAFVLNRDVRCVAPLVSFGGWVLATNLFNFAARNSDNVLIGAWLGSAAVGIYGLAYQVMIAPLMAITWPTSGILLATLRGTDPHSPQARTTVEGVLSATAMMTFPTMAYCAFGLEWPVHALLSDRWQQVAAIVAWLAPASALQSIASYSGTLLLSVGRARAQFLLSVTNAAVLLVTFLVALPFGLTALVKAYVVVVTLISLGFLAIIVALTGLSWRDMARALSLPAIATGVGLVAVAGLMSLRFTDWQSWTLATIIYGSCVLGIYALMHREMRRTISILAGHAPTADA